MDTRKLAAIVAPVMLTAGLLGASAVAAPNSQAVDPVPGDTAASASASPTYSVAPSPIKAEAEPAATPTVSQPAVAKKNPCDSGTGGQPQSPACQMKSGVEERLKACPPAATASPSPARPAGDGTTADQPPRSDSSTPPRAAGEPHISTCMDQVAGIQGAHTHQKSFQDSLQSKVTGFQEGQKERDVPFSAGVSDVCSIPLSLLANVPPDVTRFEPKGRFC
ncbi:hypothetical protein GKQ77_13555 [Streptomyces sp. BG9H]|uniref:Secreted protein n=1 Tax=Streptomyces anatolicus TaxID=2675858 RepID=A0ABS6YMF9_9ACTN|nr:hypothetical protein [Streptomyces anatolicus]MBW5422579.1 hypothetical protein [Streptomyces anatolicus]